MEFKNTVGLLQNPDAAVKPLLTDPTIRVVCTKTDAKC